MYFAPTFLYVVPTGNTLPTTGSTGTLAPNQFGIYKDDNQAATAGNVGTAKYLYAAQGYPQEYPGVGTKKSNKIYTKNIRDWYKVDAQEVATVQITDITDFAAVCSETVTLSFWLSSFYLNTASANGLMRSFTLQTPCCECGDNPCENVDIEALVDEFVAAINSDLRTLGVGNFIVASRVGSGDTSTLRLTGIPLTADGVSCDPNVNPYIYDRMWFRVFAYKGPQTSQDFNVWNTCDPFATVTTIQEATYLTNTWDQVLQMEKNYWTYNVPPIAKPLYDNVNFNHGYTSQVEEGVFYDLYYITFESEDNSLMYNAGLHLEERVVIAVPTGTGATIETILETYYEPFADQTPETPSTSTTSTTTSSTTTTTTTAP